MAHAASGIGLQNPAFFGRAELLEWVNGLLAEADKVEQVRAPPSRIWAPLRAFS